MRKKLFGIVALLLLTPQWASAHVPVPGLNDFYNGLLHPFVSLPHLLILIALGILLSQHPKKDTAAFLSSLAVGLGLATFSIGFSTETFLLLGAGLLGFLILLNWTVPYWSLGLFAVLTGLLMGLDFAGETVISKAALNLGTGVTLYFVFVCVTGLGEGLGKKKWQQIGLRIMGSWIAAIALLVLSLLLFVKKT